MFKGLSPFKKFYLSNILNIRSFYFHWAFVNLKRHLGCLFVSKKHPAIFFFVVVVLFFKDKVCSRYGRGEACH